MTRNTLPKILLALMILICGLLTVDLSLLYSQESNLEVKGKIEAESLTIKGGASLPLTPVKGEVFYRSDEDTFYVFDGTAWQPVGGEGGGPDRTVATKIVAASDTDLTDRDADYICTGTDDQNIIQQAIDDLGSNPGVVYLLEGTYNISGSINLDDGTSDGFNDSGKAIIGTGSGTKLVTTALVTVISAASVNYILISQLLIDGNNTGGNGIYFDPSVTYSKIDKVWVENIQGHGIYLHHSCSNNTISENNVRLCGYDGIELSFSCDNNIISGNNLQSNGVISGGGILLSYSSNNIVSGNNLQDDLGIELYYSSNNTISGNNVQSSKGCGIHLYEYCYNNTISGNTLQSSYSSGISIYRSFNNIVSKNVSHSNGSSGINIERESANNVVSGNVVYENGYRGGEVGCSYDEIWLFNKSKNNLIFSNHLSDTTGPTGQNWAYMISTSASCDNNYIVGNQLIIPSDASGNLAEINDEGTNTTYTDKIKLTFEPSSSQNPGSGGMITVGASSYIPLSPSYAYTLSNTQAISDGKAPGDILILENKTSWDISIVDGSNVQIKPDPPNSGKKTLTENDVLMLIWDGSDWVEIGYSLNI